MSVTDSDNNKTMKSLYEIVQRENKFYGYVNVAKMFLGFVIGKRGVNKSNIEKDTKTEITIPQFGGDDYVRICGNSHESVSQALTKILSSVDYARQKTVFTHFLSVKTTTETAKKSFLSFKTSVLEQCSNDYGVSEIMFQKDFKLHMTLCIVVLGDQREIDGMMQACNEFKRDNGLLFDSPIKIHVRGLECMNNDHSKVEVLYGKIEPSPGRDRLQLIADKIVDHLVLKRIILKREYDAVILHVTLMNVSFNKYKKQNSELPNADTKVFRSIDCTNIMDRFADWDFGEVDIDEIELSRRHISREGIFYESDGSLKFEPE